ncbi:hypothetical protein PQ676_06630 [Rickettsia felis]|nr:hypothetical protein [Rickettsia felis]
MIQIHTLMKGDILSSLSMDEEAITEYHNARLVNLHNDDTNYQQIIQDMISLSHNIPQCIRNDPKYN